MSHTLARGRCGRAHLPPSSAAPALTRTPVQVQATVSRLNEHKGKIDASLAQYSGAAERAASAAVLSAGQHALQPPYSPYLSPSFVFLFYLSTQKSGKTKVDGFKLGPSGGADPFSSGPAKKTAVGAACPNQSSDFVAHSKPVPPPPPPPLPHPLCPSPQTQCSPTLTACPLRTTLASPTRPPASRPRPTRGPERAQAQALGLRLALHLLSLAPPLSFGAAEALKNRLVVSCLLSSRSIFFF